MTDMNEVLRELLARRQAEQRAWMNEAIYGRQQQAPPEPTGEPDALRREVAAARGIEEHAHRLTGTTREELEADAARFARDIAEARGAPPPISFDGGARETPPGPAPGMDGLIRASREQRGRERFDRAAQLDRDGSPWQ